MWPTHSRCATYTPLVRVSASLRVHVLLDCDDLFLVCQNVKTTSLPASVSYMSFMNLCHLGLTRRASGSPRACTRKPNSTLRAEAEQREGPSASFRNPHDTTNKRGICNLHTRNNNYNRSTHCVTSILLYSTNAQPPPPTPAPTPAHLPQQNKSGRGHAAHTDQASQPLRASGAVS